MSVIHILNRDSATHGQATDCQLTAQQLAWLTNQVVATDPRPLIVAMHHPPFQSYKDRTGLVTALLLDLAGVHPATIAQDYGLTTDYAADLFAELRTQAAAMGRDMARFERYLEAKPEAMFNTLVYLGQAYGGAADYLRHIGLAKMQIHELRQAIIN